MSDTSKDFSESAFSVVHYGCATGYYSFGHEMGHNQGANHNIEDAVDPDLFPYSYGYQNTTAQPPWRDVMAYDCSAHCDRKNFWSNPDLQYNGLPTGIAGKADNRLTLNTTSKIAASWRKSVAITSGADVKKGAMKTAAR